MYSSKDIMLLLTANGMTCTGEIKDSRWSSLSIVDELRYEESEMQHSTEIKALVF